MKTMEVMERVLAGKRIREKTAKNYRFVFGTLLEFSDEFPGDVGQVDAYVNFLARKGYSDNSILMCFKTVKSASNYMRRIMGRNANGNYKWLSPFDDAETPKVAHKSRRYFSQEELISIMKACRSDREAVLIGMLIDSGCRIGECILQGRDVGQGYFVSKLSSKTGQRRYRLNIGLCQKLKSMAGSDDGYCFKDEDGKDSVVNSLRNVVRRVIKRAGITGSKVGAHTIRHSVGTMVARKTGSALAVKAMLQHDSQDTSMGYIHDVDDEIQQSLSPLELIGAGQVGKVMSEQHQLTEYAGQQVEIVDEDGIIDMTPDVEEFDLIDDMFDMVPEGVKIRPQLSSDDLLYLRRMMVSYARNNQGSSDVARGRELLRRMLRKVK